jgi:hypothetical protein
MKLSKMAELAAKNEEALPEVIGMMCEALENTDNRLETIENAIRELAPKISTHSAQLAEMVNLKKQVKDANEEIKILKVWLDDKTMAKVSEVDANNDMVIVRKKNDGLLPNDRAALKAQEREEALAQ